MFKLKKYTRKPYINAIGDMVVYHGLTLTLLSFCLSVFNKFAMLLITSTGRVAITSSDFLFLMTSFRGLLLLVLGLIVFFLYVAFDLNAKIIYANHIVRDEKDEVFRSMYDGFRAIRSFFCPEGLVLVLYITLLIPVIGIGMAPALTKHFYIPTFITSVIYTTPLYLLLYIATIALLFMIGVMHVFILHGILIDQLSIKQSAHQSRHLVKDHLPEFVGEMIIFGFRMALFVGAVMLCLIVLPIVVVSLLPLSQAINRYLLIFICLFGGTVTTFAAFLTGPFLLIKLTELYFEYTNNTEILIPVQRPKFPNVYRIAIMVFVIGCLSLSYVFTVEFDTLFPNDVSTQIIAHRGGGNEDVENSVRSLKTAISLNAYGSEIDIQRSKDGHYVINHDKTFKRVAGIKKKVSAMTLEQIKQLTIKNKSRSDSKGEPVATFEEMLDAMHNRIVLFAELKGKTADHQMADDVVKMVKEHHMTDHVVLISLKYNLINYIETAYPEMQTGYLTFASYGNTEKLNCDYIGLEEESASYETIDAIHKQDKKVMVWTANSKSKQRRYLLTNADAIITDNISQANKIIHEIETRDDLERLIDTLLNT